jgi:hypothetical protein
VVGYIIIDLVDNIFEVSMRTIPIIVIVCMLVATGFLCGCNEQSDKKEEAKYSIVGTWMRSNYSEEVYYFRENGTFFIDQGTNGSLHGIYLIKNATILSLIYTDGLNNWTYDYEYKFLTENTLYRKYTDIESGESQELTFYRITFI